MAGDNPYSFLRVVRSEIELGDTDPYSPAVYEHAKANLEKLVREGVLIKDETESVYVYQLERQGHVQTGIVALSSVDDYESGVIKVHEKTRPEKEADRIQHILTTNAQTGPVFLAFRDTSGIAEILRTEIAREPLYNFIAADGIRHTVWKAVRSADIVQAFAKIPNTYIADGHHRAASSCRVRAELRSRRPNSGDAAFNYFLSVLFPHNELRVLPYNRTVKRLPAAPAEILAQLERAYTVTPSASAEPPAKGHVSMYMQGTWYGLAPRPGEPKISDPVEALDVSVLYTKALHPIFGIQDPRTDPMIEYIGGIRGTEELTRLVDSGKAAAAFSLYPVSMDEILAIADRGQTMAPKSTWFEPKLRSGLLIHQFQS